MLNIAAVGSWAQARAVRIRQQPRRPHGELKREREKDEGEDDDG